MGRYVMYGEITSRLAHEMRKPEVRMTFNSTPVTAILPYL